MMIEGNEYYQSVTLAAVPVSALKCVLSHCLSVVRPLAAVVSFRKGAYTEYFYSNVNM